MPSDWKESKWGDIASLEYGKALRTYQKSNGKYPVYGTNGLVGWHDAPLCNSDGVIIGRKGAYRGVHYSRVPFFVIDTAFYLKPKVKDLDMRFAYYELLTHDINSMDSGSAIPSTSRSEFYNLKVELPPLEEQQTIAHILGTFDDKIELNQQTNRTIEEIGQAIFKRWFVDFEFPNEEGKPYKSSGGEIVDSELGPIPKGWQVGVFGDIASKVSKPVSRSEKLTYDKYVSLDDMPRKQIFLVNYSSVNDVDSSMIGFEKGDVLFGAMRPYFHKVSIAPFTGITRTTTFVIRAKGPAYQSYLSFLCFEKSTVDYADSTSVGSTIPYAVYEALERMPVLIPERKIASQYQSFVEPFIEKAFCNSAEIMTLSQVRKTLLPKLMSGKIRVPFQRDNEAS